MGRMALRTGWICLAVVNAGILGFGIVVLVVSTGSEGPLYRSIGLASVGLGLFGGLLALVPFRRGERWAWFALWFLPVFWSVHLFGNLPPGEDHVHQVVFIVLSLVGLLLPARAFFPAPIRPAASSTASSIGACRRMPRIANSRNACGCRRARTERVRRG